jgi:hypothetical protein
MSEAKIQSQMVLHFSQEYPNRRGELFAAFQETNSAAQGSNMLSKGLISGVSDLIYIDALKRLVGIEVKAPNTYHDTIHVLEQCRFLIKNAFAGWFCTSLESFKEIIESDGKSGGISPYIIWESILEKHRDLLKLENSEPVDEIIFKCNQYKKRTGKNVPKFKF